jgi:two-component system, OmpR family, alkaline phosphatase synthesis response regulator PhoP
MSHSKSSVLKRKRILVVEDEADFLDMLRLRFKEEGYAIATARNGIDAVKKARSLLPDLILLDVMLPELDGFAVCEILRNDAATATIPVIMVTGLCGQMPRCAGIESGATDFVTKPTSPDEIVLKVRERLRDRVASPAGVLTACKAH